MSLDPSPSDAELIRMAEERTRKRIGGLEIVLNRAAPPGTALFVQKQRVVGAITGLDVWPLSLHIPWSCLISDNIKHTTDKTTGKRYCQTEYRDARKRIRALAADVMQGRPPADCPLALVGRIWLPNNRRHDAHNYGKCVNDSLTGVVFTDDSWLYDTRWIRAGVDVDAPRAEIVITPLTGATP